MRNNEKIKKGDLVKVTAKSLTSWYELVKR